jgi:hypothetical protein
MFSGSTMISSFFSTICTFNLVCLGWVLFRAQSVSAAGDIFMNIFKTAGGGAIEMPIILMLAIAVLSHIVRNKWNVEEWFIRLPAPAQAFGYACATVVIYLFFTTEQRFIYFQF